jgi:hypothetical protein
MDYKMEQVSTAHDSVAENSMRSNGSWNKPEFRLELDGIPIDAICALV